MKRARFSSEAEQEVREAREWYLNLGEALDQAFEQDLHAVVEQIRRFSSAAAKVRGEIRRIPLRRFPYSVFYRERERDLFILAVLHQARHPARWPVGP